MGLRASALQLLVISADLSVAQPEVQACLALPAGSSCSYAGTLGAVSTGACEQVGPANRSVMVCMVQVPAGFKAPDPSCSVGLLHSQSGACCASSCQECREVAQDAAAQNTAACSVEQILRVSPLCAQAPPPCIVAMPRQSVLGGTMQQQAPPANVLGPAAGAVPSPVAGPPLGESSQEGLPRWVPELAAPLAGGFAGGACALCACCFCTRRLIPRNSSPPVFKAIVLPRRDVDSTVKTPIVRKRRRQHATSAEREASPKPPLVDEVPKEGPMHSDRVEDALAGAFPEIGLLPPEEEQLFFAGNDDDTVQILDIWSTDRTDRSSPSVWRGTSVSSVEEPPAVLDILPTPEATPVNESAENTSPSWRFPTDSNQVADTDLDDLPALHPLSEDDAEPSTWRSHKATQGSSGPGRRAKGVAARQNAGRGKTSLTCTGTNGRATHWHAKWQSLEMDLEATLAEDDDENMPNLPSSAGQLFSRV
eukprot:TRINITY_DN14963_c0_g1_i1.p1 TRINITY_DN14963_c0_g1~~TRINITY_DN14963_c0_g1_i1.p1  ORF type:complete len:479 (-),score=93.23 TRINITY_DN14963_c0_g1_i1:46-1482(-)